MPKRGLIGAVAVEAAALETPFEDARSRMSRKRRDALEVSPRRVSVVADHASQGVASSRSKATSSLFLRDPTPNSVSNAISAFSSALGQPGLL
jgi:hypothetical protein